MGKRDEEDFDEEENDEEEDDDGEDDESEAKSKGKKKPEEVVMTQRRFTSVMSREKSEGKRAGRRALLQELDVEDVDELKALVEKGRGKDSSDEKDQRRNATETDKAKRERDEARAEAEKLRLDTKKERALLEADVPAKQVARVARMLDIEPDADDSEIEAAVEDLKEQFPHLFTAATVDDEDEEDDDDSSDGKNSRNRGSGPPRSDPGQPKRKRRPSGNTKDQAKSLLHERHPQLAKK